MLLVSLLLSMQGFAAEQILTGVMAPYIVTAEGVPPQGVMVELVEALSKHIPWKTSIREVPWARLTQSVAQKTDKLGFPLIRSASREKSYSWLVPLLEDDVVIVSLSPITLPTNDKLQVGVLRSSTIHELVNQAPNLQIDWTTDNMQAFLKLRGKRIQGWMTLKAIADATIIIGGDQPEKYFMTKSLARAQLFLVGHSDYPKDKAASWLLAMEKIRKDGALKKLKAKYERAQIRLAP